MADPTVKLIFSGDGRDAERAIASLERKIEGMEQKYKRLGETMKKSQTETGPGLERAFDGALLKLGSMVTVGAAVQTVLSGMVTKAAEVQQKLGDLWRDQRPAEARLQIQTGFTPKLAREQMEQILPHLQRTPVMGVADLTRMQTEIAGAGFDEEDTKSGAVARELLNLRAASGTFGAGSESPTESAKAMSGLLIASGSKLKANDIKRMGSKVAALAAKTNLQFSDLKQLSQVSGALTQLGLGESEQLAAFSTTFESGGSMVGSTGLKNIALRMGAGGAEKEKIDLLAGIGLKPEDVAISKGGLTLGQAGETLRGALSNKTEVEKNQFLSKFFGGDAVSSAATLFSDEGWKKYQDRLALADRAQGEMQQRLETFQQSREGVVQRNKINEEVALWRKGQFGEIWSEYEQRKSNEYTARRAMAKTWGGAMSEDLTATIADMMTGLDKRMGFEPGRGPAGSTVFAGRGIEGNDWSQVAKEQLKAIQEQTEVLKEMAKKQNERPINRNAQQE